ILTLSMYISVLLKKLTAAGQRAEEANRAKNRFLANMSHEMRTPLNGIIGLIDLLKGTPLTPEQEVLAKTADASARTLLHLMQDILDLSKIEAGKVQVQTSGFDLYDLAKNAMALIEPQARSKNLELFLHVDPKVPFLLQGDPLLLRQVLLNLLGNSVKFTERGEVWTRVLLESETPSSATVRFEVVDTGIGIPFSAQQRIFDRFAQADESITRKFGGTGLGTTISKEIVEMMGGRIGLSSTPGKGSTFWFVVEFEKQRAETGEPAEEKTLAERRALVVSRDPDPAEAIRGMLATWGVRSVRVDRSAQAFAHMVSAADGGLPFDFVVVAGDGLDMDAIAFARVVRSDPTIRQASLVLVSAGGEDPEAMVKGGYTASLSAPPDKTLLFNAIHLSRPDAGGDPSVASLADRYRQRHAGGRKLRVLVAEDNVTNQMVIAKILERAGHEVTLVGDGEKALDALKAKPYDITLMDLHMPVMGGVEAAKLYRFMERKSPRMPIVALTADATPEAQAECSEAGMEACLTKPIDTGKLFELFEALLPGNGTAERREKTAGADPEPEEAGKGEAGAGPVCLDPQMLRQLEALSGKDFVVRVVWTFLKGSKERLKELEKGASLGDVETVRQAAHALKGNAGQIGAVALMHACERFSGIGAPELEARGREYLEKVREEFSRARIELDRFLGTRNSAVS
ncbi:MAG: histidine kinase, partial [Deltaproteobacteria bacterium]|nr:histidine kinase [Deltaproteobacteria bacterium]